MGHSKSMSQQISPRLGKNNFDLLRLLFAATVFFFHADEISGYQSLNWLSNIFSAELAVRSFFVVSGFLIFMSYEHSSSLSSYFSKRIRRIYPAYLTVILLSAFGLALVSTKGMNEYFSAQWVRYVAANLVFLNFLQPTLPGVFEHNIYSAVNGALWTLKVEVLFYISVPAFVYFFGKISRTWLLAGGYLLSFIYVIICDSLAARTGHSIFAELGHQLPAQLCYFLGGAIFYYHLPFFEKYARYIFPASVLVLAVHQFYPLTLLEPIALASVVVFFGLFLYVGEFGRYGDFSYGIYILHFPILQVFIQYGWLHETSWLYLLATLFITLVAAILMCHGVEKRFLLRGSHYISRANSAQGHRIPEKGS